MLFKAKSILRKLKNQNLKILNVI